MLKFSINIVFRSPSLVNSAYPDEMPHYAALQLGIHCLSSIHLGVTSSTVVPAKSDSDVIFVYNC